MELIDVSANLQPNVVWYINTSPNKCAIMPYNDKMVWRRKGGGGGRERARARERARKGRKRGRGGENK